MSTNGYQSITSTAAGLSTDRVFLGSGEWRVFFNAPDWNSSKEARLYTSFQNVDESYSPEKRDEEGNDYVATSNQSILTKGECWLALHLTNPGTGVTIYFRKVETN